MTDPHDPPAGFRLLPPYPNATYNDLIGPFYVMGTAEGGLRYGFRVRQEICNAQGACHGGMLAGFADIVLTGGTNYVAQLQRFVVTVSLTTDFLAPAPLGSWVETSPEVLRVGRSTAFSQCLLRADGKPVLRASATLHMGPERDAKYDRIRRALEQ